MKLQVGSKTVWGQAMVMYMYICLMLACDIESLFPHKVRFSGSLLLALTPLREAFVCLWVPLVALVP